MANSYLSYDPLDIKALTSGIGTPPAWMFQQPWDTFEDAQKNVGQANQASAQAEYTQLKADEAKTSSRGRQKMAEIAKQNPDKSLTDEDLFKQMSSAAIGEGAFDEALDFAKTRASLMPKVKDPEGPHTAINSYGGVTRYDPADGSIFRDGVFGDPNDEKGPKPKNSVFVNSKTGQIAQVDMNDTEALTAMVGEGYLPYSKFSTEKIDELRRRAEAESKATDAPKQESQGIFDWVKGLASPSAKKESAPAPTATLGGPPRAPRPGKKWVRASELGR